MPTSYNDANFRLQFPAFANTVAYPTATIQLYWTMGTDYISSYNGSYIWNAAQAQLANDLMCAHTLFISTNVANGQSTGVVTAATEGSVNVTFMPPPAKNAFQYWLSSSPYGMQLRALLRSVASVGMYVGGSPERQGFRKIAGVF